MEPPFQRGQILTLLRQVIGTKVEIAGEQIANRGHDYLVLLLKLSHPSIDIVMKLAGPEARMASDFDRTARLHRLVAEKTTIPMPETLGVSATYDPWRYLIRTNIHGREFAYIRMDLSSDELSDAYRQIGDAVAQLHAIQFPAFGEPFADAGATPDQDYFSALCARVRYSIRSHSLQGAFIAAVEQRKHLFQDVHLACLCHEDLQGYKILFQQQQGGWRLATILDFDKAWAGHHEIDLARMDIWKGMTGPEFWTAYQAIHPVQPEYEERRPIYQLLWCFEYAMNTGEHLADTERLCRALDVPWSGYF